MRTDKEIELPWEQLEIVRLLKTELRTRVERVEATNPASREGRKARAQLKEFLAKLHALAVQSGSKQVVDAVGQIRLSPMGFIRPEEFPGWHPGGSLN